MSFLPAASNLRALPLGRRALAAALAAAATTLGLALAGAPAASAGDWTVAEIDGPPGTTRIQPNAVNDHEVVVGKARFPGRTEDTAFRWEDGQMIELDLGGAPSSEAFDINDAGVIVGRLGDDYGAVWTATRTTSSLSRTAFNISGRYGSGAFGINESGLIAGSAGDTGTMPAPSRSTYDNRFPALTTGGGGWSRIPMPDGSRQTENGWESWVIGGDAMQVNEHGLVLVGAVNMGGQPRLWSGGIAGEPFDMVAGNQGLNDLGQIAGRTTYANANPNTDPFSARVWDGAQYVDVGAGQPQSRANAINNMGWVVGRAGVTDWQPEFRNVGNAWLWRLDGAPSPLYVLGPTGWSYANARDVNDNGVIVGVGAHGEKVVGFMLTPASIAHRLTGTIWGADGRPVAGAAVRIVGAAGVEPAPGIVSGADGRYEATLPRGTYEVTVQPHGAYAPDAGAGCAIAAVYTCALGLRQNRVVDFYAVPRPPAPEGGRRGAGPASRGPAIRGPRSGATVRVDRSGTVRIGLGPFAEAVRGSVTLRQPAARARARRGRARGRASARRARRPAAVVLGRGSFRAGARKAVVARVTLNRAGKRLLRQRGRLSVVAVVQVRGASSSATSRASFRLTLRPAARGGARARGRSKGKGKGKGKPARPRR